MSTLNLDKQMKTILSLGFVTANVDTLCKSFLIWADSTVIEIALIISFIP